MGSSALAEFRMLVPKKDRLTVYKYLFKEGVMVAKKDCNKPQHDDPELPVKNLYVIKLLTSLKSRGYVTESFSWQWYYWYLTNEGIEYLREYLHLPSEGGKGGWGGGKGDGYRRNFGGDGGKGGGKGGFGGR